MIVTTLPYLTGMSGLIYLAGVSVLNAGFLWYAWKLLRVSKDRAADEHVPMDTFSYSVLYLMLLFAFLLADHYFVNLTLP